jgi:hypothetical protein
MSLFGWSLPPGCHTLPGEEEYPCEVCNGFPESDCICPECPECGGYGDPDCYKNHGLVKTPEQIQQFTEREKEWEEEEYQ